MQRTLSPLQTIAVIVAGMEQKKSAGFRLKEILGSLAGRDAPDEVRSIEAAISRLEAERVAAQSELATVADGRVQALLDDDDDACDRLDRRGEALHRVCERVEVAMPELQRRLADARKRSDEAARRAAYLAAQEASKAAKKALKTYPDAARQIVDIIEQIARSDAAVAAANDALPEGHAPIEYVEYAVRGWAADEREEIVETTDEKIWQHEGTGWIVSAAHVEDIKTEDGRTGTYEKDLGGGLTTYRVVKRIRRTETIVLTRSSSRGNPLSTEVFLPSLVVNGPTLWAPAGVATTYGPPDGSAVLAAINERRSHLHDRPIDPRGDRVTETRTRIIELTEK